MTDEDTALRIRMLPPFRQSLAMLGLALIEANRIQLAEDLGKIAQVEPDEGGAEVPWELIDALIARLRGAELRAWMVAFGRAWDANGVNLIEELSQLARQRLAQ